LFFSVLTITNIVNKVSVKYKTKNIKTEDKAVFLTTINHIRANTISSRNFRLTATRIYSVWLSASFDCPLKKIRRVINEIPEKTVDRIKASLRLRLRLRTDESKYKVDNNSTLNTKSIKMYLRICINKSNHLIKSLMTVYMAPKTPSSESTIVKTGVCHPVNVSSFTPPHTVIRIMPII